MQRSESRRVYLLQGQRRLSYEGLFFFFPLCEVDVFVAECSVYFSRHATGQHVHAQKHSMRHSGGLTAGFFSLQTSCWVSRDKTESTTSPWDWGGKKYTVACREGWIDTQNWYVHKLSFPLLDFSFILRVFSASSLRVHFWLSWMCPGAKIAAKWLWMFHSEAPIITITKNYSNSNCDKNTLSKEINF